MLKTFLQRLITARRAFLLAALSGTLYFIGFVGFDIWPLSFICSVPVLWALLPRAGEKPLGTGMAFLVAWCFGTVTQLGGFTWIAHMLENFAYLPWYWAYLGLFLMSAGQGTLLGAWGAATYWLVVRRGLNVVVVAPITMIFFEWCWPAIFPHYLGYALYRLLPLVQSVDLWGVIGLTGLLTLVSSVVFASLRGHEVSRAWAITIVLWGLNIGYGILRMVDVDDTVHHASRSAKIAVVQANMGIYNKTSQPAEGLRRHRQQSLEVEQQNGGADLIVWPESGYYYGVRTGTKNLKREVMGPVTTPILFGGLRRTVNVRERTSENYNSAFLLDKNGDVRGVYDKNELLVFGEYIPLLDTFSFIKSWLPHSSVFRRGTTQTPLSLHGITYGIAICYESILPNYVRKIMQHEPNILINLTNDAWYGDSREPLIHLVFGAFRAIESRRFLVRATNTGISAIIDPVGRIGQRTQTFAIANIPPTEVMALEGKTIYSALGDWLGYIALACLLFWERDLWRTLVRNICKRRSTSTI